MEAAAPPNGDAVGVVATCEFELPNGNKEPKIDGVAAVGVVFGAAKDCANAKGAEPCEGALNPPNPDIA